MTDPNAAGTSPEAPLWEPSEADVARANLTRFQEFLLTTRGLTFDDYNALWRWSVTDL